MKKALYLLLIISAFQCSENKFYIKGKIDPKNQVRVFLDPRLIISGYMIDGSSKTVNIINNEKSSYNFFIPDGDQELLYQVRYTRGIYAYVSKSEKLKISGKPGDRIFVCAEIKEVGDISPTGGQVDSIPQTKLLYVKDEEKENIYLKQDRNKKEQDRSPDLTFFKKKCNALIYGISEK